MLKVTNSKDSARAPAINMLVYGQPGQGKTTFAANSENCLVADVENGAVFLGVHGISCDVVHIDKWDDIEELEALVKAKGYKTIVIDPLGELLEKLINKLKSEGYGQGKPGTMSLSLQGWGVAKDKFKLMMRKFRDLDCDLILVAHSSEKKDEDRTIYRPKMQASLDEDVCAMMQIVGYLKVDTDGKKKTRRMYLQPTDKYYAKDRTGTLPETMDDPTFHKIKEMVLSNPFFGKLEQIKETQAKTDESFLTDLQ